MRPLPNPLSPLPPNALCAIHPMLLLLDTRSELLDELLGHGLPCLVEHVHELATMRLVEVRKERVRKARVARAPRAPNAVHIVLWGG